MICPLSCGRAQLRGKLPARQPPVGLDAPARLLRQAFGRKDAERSVLIADLSGAQIGRRVKGRLRPLEAAEDIDEDAFRRRAVKALRLAAAREEFAAFIIQRL